MWTLATAILTPAVLTLCQISLMLLLVQLVSFLSYYIKEALLKTIAFHSATRLVRLL